MDQNFLNGVFSGLISNFLWAIIVLLLGFFGFKTGIKIYKKYKMEKIKIDQRADEMKNTTGMDVKLTEGEDILLKDIQITQEAQKMDNVKGLSLQANGTQSARLQGIHVKQGNTEVKISDDPNIRVEFNKQVK